MSYTRDAEIEAFVRKAITERGMPEQHFADMIECLRTAEYLVTGPRAQVYGPPALNFGRASAIIGPRIPATPLDIPLIMIGIKMSRLYQSPTHLDSWVDIAGFAACGYSIARRLDDDVTNSRS